VNVTVPKGFKTSLPASQAFVWSASLVKPADFVLNRDRTTDLRRDRYAKLATGHLTAVVLASFCETTFLNGLSRFLNGTCGRVCSRGSVRNHLQQLAGYALVDFRSALQLHWIAHERLDGGGGEAQLHLCLCFAAGMQ